MFDFLCERLFDSFDLPMGPARYLELMSPLLADGESIWSRAGLLPHGRAWRTIRDEWPKVRTDIDTGHPSPLGLIKVKSSDPRQLKQDHQVLAYGYDLTGGVLTLRLYDPNQPGRDDVDAVARSPRPHEAPRDHAVAAHRCGLRVLPRHVRGGGSTLEGSRP